MEGVPPHYCRSGGTAAVTVGVRFDVIFALSHATPAIQHNFFVSYTLHYIAFGDDCPVLALFC